MVQTPTAVTAGEVSGWSSEQREICGGAEPSSFLLMLNCFRFNSNVQLPPGSQHRKREIKKCGLLISNHVGAGEYHHRVICFTMEVFTSGFETLQTVGNVSWQRFKKKNSHLNGLRKLHVQTSRLTLSAREILEEIMKMLAHSEEVSSIPWALSTTSGSQNILIFFLL